MDGTVKSVHGGTGNHVKGCCMLLLTSTTRHNCMFFRHISFIVVRPGFHNEQIEVGGIRRIHIYIHA